MTTDTAQQTPAGRPPAGARGAAARAAARRRTEQQAAAVRAEQARHWQGIRDARRRTVARLARTARTRAVTSPSGVLDSLGAGSALIIRRTRLRARVYAAHGESAGDRVVRQALVWSPAPVTIAVAVAQPRVLWVAVPVWAVMALRRAVEADTVARLRRHLLATAVEDQEHAEDQEPEVSLTKTATPDQSVTDSEGLGLLREAIGARSRVHLTELTGPLTARTGEGWESTHVRALLTRLGVPAGPTRSDTRSGSSTGIRASDLPPPLSEQTPGGDVAAGQPTNNNTNNAAAPPPGEGLEESDARAWDVIWQPDGRYQLAARTATTGPAGRA